MATPTRYFQVNREGTRQSERYVQALNPSHFAVDERDLADLLIQAKSFATQIQYYDSANTPDGNWEDFFRNDTVLAAVIAKQDFAGIQQAFEDLVLDLVGPDGLKTAQRSSFRTILLWLIDLCRETNNWLNEATDAVGLHTAIGDNIKQQAAVALAQLIVYDVAGTDDDALVEGTTLFTDYTGDPGYGDLDTIWGVDFGISPDPSEYYGNIGASYTNKIKTALPGVRAIFDAMLEARQSLANEATKYLTVLLTDYPQHKPHFALFMSFLGLFEHVRTDISNLTEHQLEFYYRDVLQLVEQEAVPSKVHMALELAKNVTRKLIPQGLRVEAGTDSEGNNVYYTVDRDTVLSKTSIGEMQSIYPDRNSSGGVKQVNYSPVANSENGTGEPFEPGTTPFLPFGETQFAPNGSPVAFPSMPTAEVGFAIASPQLWLQSGTRTITLSLQLASAPDLSNYAGNNATAQAANFATDFVANVRFDASGKEAWVDLPYQTKDKQGNSVSSVELNRSTNVLTIRLQLDAAAEELAYFAESTLTGYNTNYPVLRAFVDGKAALVNQVMRTLQILQYTIAVDVVGHTNLKVSNGQTSSTEVEDFLAFGLNPKAGDKFFIGSAEIFSKKLTGLKINVQWKGLPAGGLDTWYEEYVDFVEEQIASTRTGKPIMGWVKKPIVFGKDGGFSARLQIFQDGKWQHLCQKKEPALPNSTGSEQHEHNWLYESARQKHPIETVSRIKKPFEFGRPTEILNQPTAGSTFGGVRGPVSLVSGTSTIDQLAGDIVTAETETPRLSEDDSQDGSSSEATSNN